MRYGVGRFGETHSDQTEGNPGNHRGEDPADAKDRDICNCVDCVVHAPRLGHQITDKLWWLA
jgi:hypothetical protein